MTARLVACALTCLCTVACAPKDAIAISNAWVRAPAPGLAVAAGYLEITNSTSAPVALTSATSPVAGSIEIHIETHDGDMMQMRQVDSIAVPRGQTVSLAPGGTHLMLLQFTGTASPVPVTLTFDDGTKREVAFELRALDGDHP